MVQDGWTEVQREDTFVRLLLDISERNGDSGTSGRDMLERRGRGESESRASLLDERPRVERVEKVDVARLPVQNLPAERIPAPVITPVKRC